MRCSPPRLPSIRPDTTSLLTLTPILTRLLSHRYVLLVPGRTSANNLSPEIRKAYLGSVAVLSFLWLLYPVAWGLADGGNVITPTSEMIFYGVLDVLAKPVFCFYHCFSMSKCDYRLLGFSSGKYSDGLTAEELMNNEKVGGARGAHLLGHHGQAETTRNATASRVGVESTHTAERQQI